MWLLRDIHLCEGVTMALEFRSPYGILGCFRKPRRKRGIRGNQSTATVPVLKRPPDQFAELFAVIGWERLCVCPGG